MLLTDSGTSCFRQILVFWVCASGFGTVARLHNEAPVSPVEMDRLQKFIALPANQQGLFVRSWFALGWYRLAVSMFTLRWLTRGLQHSPASQPTAAPSAAQLAEAQRVGRAVAQAASATPWASSCLVQVLVVQHFLAAQGISGQFYLGVSRAAGVPSLAHAWLQCGDFIVNGDACHQDFTVISSYASACWAWTT